MSAGPRSGGTVAQFQTPLHHWDQTIRLRRLSSYPEGAAAASYPSTRPALTVVIPSPARDLLFAFAPPPLYPAALAEHRLSVAPRFAPFCGACLLRPGCLYRELPAFLRGEPGISQKPLPLKNETPRECRPIQRPFPAHRQSDRQQRTNDLYSYSARGRPTHPAHRRRYISIKCG